MFPFFQPNFFPTTITNNTSLYRLSAAVSKLAPLTLAQVKSIGGMIDRCVSPAHTCIALDGDWFIKNQELHTILCRLMEGQAVFVKKESFDRMSQNRTLSETAREYARTTFRPWGILESPCAVRASLKSAGKIIPSVVILSDFFMQPMLAAVETVESLDAVINSRRNWMVINNKNCVSVIAMLACMHAHTRENFADSMYSTIMGPRYFWQKWQFENRKIRQTFFWEPREQIVKQHLRERFKQDYTHYIQTGEAVGWVDGMHKELACVFSTDGTISKLPALTGAGEGCIKAITREVGGFRKTAEEAYTIGYGAYVENDGNSEKKMLELWKNTLSERLGVCFPERTLGKISATNYGAVHKQFSSRQWKLAAYALTCAGITAIFFLWDYNVAPLIALPLRLLTYGLPEILLANV